LEGIVRDPLRFEDLRILQAAEAVADAVWLLVSRWTPFARDAVGIQLVRAADSIGANIAEGFGRFHYGEKLQYAYYARGSLFETKYWLNRAAARDLIPTGDMASYASRLTELARQLNTWAGDLKDQRRGGAGQPGAIRETPPEYVVGQTDDPAVPNATVKQVPLLQPEKEWDTLPTPIIGEEGLAWLAAIPNP